MIQFRPFSCCIVVIRERKRMKEKFVGMFTKQTLMSISFFSGTTIKERVRLEGPGALCTCTSTSTSCSSQTFLGEDESHLFLTLLLLDILVVFHE